MTRSTVLKRTCVNRRNQVSTPTAKYFGPMRMLYVLPLVTALSASAQAEKPTLELLTKTMVGSYSSVEQARHDTDYYNIELEMTRIWPERADGAWLYVEQAVADSKAKPYRQRIYHLRQVDDSTFTSAVMSIAGGAKYYGAYADPKLLAGLVMDSVQAMEGCTLILHYRQGAFVGSTDGRACKNSRGKAVYATSEVTITPDRMVSWDRGYDEADKQVWGAEKGGYIFLKKSR